MVLLVVWLLAGHAIARDGGIRAGMASIAIADVRPEQIDTLS
jgi:hypothetical protein